VEAIVTVLKDTERFRNTSHAHITSYTCFVGFLVSTLYATDVGLALLDSVQHILLTYVFLLIGLFKTVAIAWVYGWNDMAKRVGAVSANIFTMGYGLAVVSMMVLACGLYDTMEDATYFAVAIPYGLVSFGVTTIVAFTARRHKGMTFGQWWSGVVFTGTECFRNNINEAARKHGNWTLPWAWDVVVKYIAPATLTALIVNGAFNGATHKEGVFYNYPGWVQAVGISIVVILLIAFLALAVYPSLWTSFFGEDRAPGEVAKKPATKKGAPQDEESQAAKEPFMTDSAIQS